MSSPATKLRYRVEKLEETLDRSMECLKQLHRALILTLGEVDDIELAEARLRFKAHLSNISDILGERDVF